MTTTPTTPRELTDAEKARCSKLTAACASRLSDMHMGDAVEQAMREGIAIGRAEAASPQAAPEGGLVTLTEEFAGMIVTLALVVEHTRPGTDEAMLAKGIREMLQEVIDPDLAASPPAPVEPIGEVVVTTTDDGRCVTVTRQDEDGKILSVIWEAAHGGSMTNQSPPSAPNGMREETPNGHKSFVTQDGSFRHEPLRRDEADAMLQAAEEAKAKRAADMPTEQDAVRAMWSAYQRLRELGWRETCYGPTNETVRLIESGSAAGIHEGSRHEPWPETTWWIKEPGDSWPSNPCLFKPIAAGSTGGSNG